METFTFLGRVLPSNVGITIPRMQRHVAVAAIGLELTVEFDVVSSDLIAVAQVEGVVDMATVGNYVVEGVSAVLDAAAVLEGLVLSLEMRSVVLPDGERVALDPRHPHVAALLAGMTQEQVLAAANAAPARMGYVLRDLRLALARSVD